MRDLLEEKSVFCTCSGHISVWDGVSGIEISQLEIKMVRTISLAGLVVVVANSCTNTFIRFRIWEWRQMDEGRSCLACIAGILMQLIKCLCMYVGLFESKEVKRTVILV